MSIIPEVRVTSHGTPRNSEASRPSTQPTPHTRYAGRWLLIAPLVLIGATYAVFSVLMPVAGERITYFAGFGFYWLLSGIVLPTLLIGRDGMRSIFSLPRLPVPPNVSGLQQIVVGKPMARTEGWALPAFP